MSAIIIFRIQISKKWCRLMSLRPSWMFTRRFDTVLVTTTNSVLRYLLPPFGEAGLSFPGRGGVDRALRPDPPPPKRAQLTGPPKSYRD